MCTGGGQDVRLESTTRTWSLTSHTAQQQQQEAASYSPLLEPNISATWSTRRRRPAENFENFVINALLEFPTCTSPTATHYVCRAEPPPPPPLCPILSNQHAVYLSLIINLHRVFLYICNMYLYSSWPEWRDKLLVDKLIISKVSSGALGLTRLIIYYIYIISIYKYM